MSGLPGVYVKTEDGLIRTLVPGNPGPMGPPGASNAIYSGVWRWTTKTTDANVAGQVGTNDIGWLGTALHLNEQRDDNVDVSSRLPLIQVGDEIRIQHKTDASRWARYQIDGALIDHGNWVSWPASLLETHGTVPNNNTEMLVTLTTQGAIPQEVYVSATPPDPQPLAWIRFVPLGGDKYAMKVGTADA